MNNRSMILALIAIALGALIFFAPTISEYFNQSSQPENNWQENNWQEPEWQPPSNQPPPNQPIAPPQIQSYQDALASGKQLNKNIFLFFTADWCTYCKQMKQQTLSDPSVQQALQPYVVYYVDTDKERAVATKYNVGSIPAYFIVTPMEQVKKNGQGMKSPASFKRWLGDRPDFIPDRIRPDRVPPRPPVPPRGG